MNKIILNGITWGHSRGITPLLAAAQRFSELNPGVEIKWRKRSLQEFTDYSVEKLTEQYDLLIIDHPWVGCAAVTKCVLPLDEYLPTEYLEDQLKNSVGYSHLSYHYNGHQWALAIDAAIPAASFRADLFENNHREVPDTFEEVIALAKEGKVAVPGISIDILMNFYMFCLAHGKEPFEGGEKVIDDATGLKALDDLRRLYLLMDREMFDYNPISVAEVMTRTDKYWYCPFAYCYSNYSRAGYAKHMLNYADPPSFGNEERLRTTLGGTGLAVSARCMHKDIALRFAQWIVSGECQSTFYVAHGGQPGHLMAWTSKQANEYCNGFFTKLLPVMGRGYTRPRYNGYLHFQDHAGDPLRQYLLEGVNPEKVLKEMNKIYKRSLQKGK